MSNIVMSRVDFRLIHGQVITKWLKYYPAKKVVIVDDLLAEDEFMAEIYKMAIPQGLVLDILSTHELADYLENNQEDLFLLFKSIETAYQMIKQGIQLPKLVVGGVPSESGKKMVFSGVYLNKTELEQLQELESLGVPISFATTPDDKSTQLASIRESL